MQPKTALLAENSQVVRALVCEQLDIADEPNSFLVCKDGFPVRYLKDVWSLFDEQAAALLQFISMLDPHDRILLFVSSPCQDLTTAGHSAGRLGFVGRQSHCFSQCLLYLPAPQSSWTAS